MPDNNQISKDIWQTLKDNVDGFAYANDEKGFIDKIQSDSSFAEDVRKTFVDNVDGFAYSEPEAFFTAVGFKKKVPTPSQTSSTASLPPLGQKPKQSESVVPSTSKIDSVKPKTDEVKTNGYAVTTPDSVESGDNLVTVKSQEEKAREKAIADEAERLRIQAKYHDTVLNWEKQPKEIDRTGGLEITENNGKVEVGSVFDKPEYQLPGESMITSEQTGASGNYKNDGLSTNVVKLYDADFSEYLKRTNRFRDQVGSIAANKVNNDNVAWIKTELPKILKQDKEYIAAEKALMAAHTQLQQLVARGELPATEANKELTKLQSEFNANANALAARYYKERENKSKEEFQKFYAEELQRSAKKIKGPEYYAAMTEVFKSQAFKGLSIDDKKEWIRQAWKKEEDAFFEGYKYIDMASHAKKLNQLDDLYDEFMRNMVQAVSYDDNGNPTSYALKEMAAEKLAKITADYNTYINTHPDRYGAADMSNGFVSAKAGGQANPTGFDKKTEQYQRSMKMLQDVISAPNETQEIGFKENLKAGNLSMLWEGMKSQPPLPFVRPLDELLTSTIQSAISKKDPNLWSESERAMMDGVAIKETFDRVSQANTWYLMGKGLSGSLEYVGEVLATSGVYSGIGGATERAALKMLKIPSRTIEKGVVTAAENLTAGQATRYWAIGRPLKFLLASAAQTAANPQRYLNGIVQRMSPGVELALSEDGDELVAALDKNYKTPEGYRTGHNQGALEATARSFGETWSEMGTERMGDGVTWLSGLMARGALKGVKSVDLLKRLYIGYYMSKFGLNKTAMMSKIISEKLGWHGFVPELAEEIVNMPLSNIATGEAPVMKGLIKYTGENDWEIDWDNLGETAGVVLLQSPIMGSPHMIASAANYIGEKTKDPMRMAVYDENGLATKVDVSPKVVDLIRQARTKDFKSLIKLKEEELPKLKLTPDERAVANRMIDSIIYEATDPKAMDEDIKSIETQLAKPETEGAKRKMYEETLATLKQKKKEAERAGEKRKEFAANANTLTKQLREFDNQLKNQLQKVTNVARQPDIEDEENAGDFAKAEKVSMKVFNGEELDDNDKGIAAAYPKLIKALTDIEVDRKASLNLEKAKTDFNEADYNKGFDQRKAQILGTVEKQPKQDKNRLKWAGKVLMYHPEVLDALMSLTPKGYQAEAMKQLAGEFGIEGPVNSVEEFIMRLNETTLFQDDKKEAEQEQEEQATPIPISTLKNKPVLFNKRKGILTIDEGGKVSIETSNKIYELEAGPDSDANEFNIQEVKVIDDDIKITDVTEETVTVNGESYRIKTDKKGSITRLIGKKDIKDEETLAAVESERNKLPAPEVVKKKIESNPTEVITAIGEVLDMSPLELNAINRLLELNMTDEIAASLDRMLEGETIEDSEYFKISLWSEDAINRLEKLKADIPHASEYIEELINGLYNILNEIPNESITEKSTEKSGGEANDESPEPDAEEGSSNDDAEEVEPEGIYGKSGKALTTGKGQKPDGKGKSNDKKPEKKPGEEKPTKPESKQAKRKIRDEATQKEADDAWDDLLNLGVVDSPEQQVKRFEAANKILAVYFKKGIFKLTDILEDGAVKLGEKLRDLFETIKEAYLAYQNRATDEELDKMQSPREVRAIDIDTILKQTQDESEPLEPDSGSGSPGDVPGENEDAELPPADIGEGGMDGEGGDKSNRGGGKRGSGGGGSLGGVRKPASDVGNYNLGDNAKSPESFNATQRYQWNVDAIKLLTELLQSGKQATPAQQEVLAKYAGFGGLKEIRLNPDSEEGWADSTKKYKTAVKQVQVAVNELEQVLKEQGRAPDFSMWQYLRESIATSFYTPFDLVHGVFDALGVLGFKDGKILEPSAGIGNFFIGMPTGMAKKSMLHGIEYDTITGHILRQLFPNTDTHIGSFEYLADTHDSYDLVVSNIPFGDVQIKGEAIHNYFFKQALDNVREGGIVAFVTSTGVMDAMNESTRKYLNDKGYFLGAVRVGNKAFKSANTSVTSDIIFIQKKGSGVKGPKNKPSFLISKPFTATDGATGNMNEYYHNYPASVIGTIKGSTFVRGASLVVESPDGIDHRAAIKAWAEANLSKVYDASKSIQETNDTELVRAEKAEFQKVNNLYFEGGRLSYIQGFDNDGHPLVFANKFVSISKDNTAKVPLFIKMRNAFNKLVYLEYHDYEDAKVEAARAELNRLYDQFLSQFGQLSDKSNSWMELDVDGYSVRALETKNKNTGEIGKSDILIRRTIKPLPSEAKADNIEEAILVSLASKGRIEPDFIAELLGKKFEEINLNDLLLYDIGKEMWVTRDEMLSGNVKRKLREAKAMLASVQKEIERSQESAVYNPELKYALSTLPKTIEALEAVQPADVPSSSIYTPLGARWIPKRFYEEFARHIFGDDARIHINHYEHNDKWVVDFNGRSTVKMDTYKVVAQHMSGSGPKEYKNPQHWLEAALNNSEPKIIDTVDEKPVYNEQATMKAINVFNKIRDEFSKWVYADLDRREELTGIYNEQYNDTVLRKYNGSHLSFPGLAKYILDPHQKDAAWMLLQLRGGIVDHMVGAGKSLVAISTIMEMRRLGIAKKPMISGLKSQLPQMIAAFKEAYPSAKVLTLMKDSDFSAQNRKRLLSQIATNDWDCVIITHDNFNAIKHDKELQIEVIQEELLAAEEALRSAKTNNAGKQFEEAIDKKIKALREKMSEMAKKTADDEVLSFQQLGVDMLFVDESQKYKNLPFTSKLGRIKGLGNQKGSIRAFNMQIAARGLHKLRGADEGLVFMSGTPISNSLSEMYLLMKYMRPTLLKEKGIKSFDQWVDLFAVAQRDIEFYMGKLKEINRFRAFGNAPELFKMYREIADVRNETNMSLDRPKANHKLITIQMTPLQKKWYNEIQMFLADKGRSQSPVSSSPNARKAFGLLAVHSAKLMSIDLRLIMSPREWESYLASRGLSVSKFFGFGDKLKTVTDNVVKIFNDTTKHKGVQLIFCDIGVPKSKNIVENLYTLLEPNNEEADMEQIFGKTGEEFWDLEKKPSVKTVKEQMKKVLDLTDEEVEWAVKESDKETFDSYREMKAQLIEKGIPEDQITFIHQWNGKKRSELYKLVNNGDIRIVIGSTEKMGVGVSIQERAVAGHHVDISWKPSDVEQRNGRIERRGNWVAKEHYNNEVDLYYYALDQSLDAYMYGLVGAKAAFIRQQRTSNLTDRWLEEMDGGADIAEMASLISGNPDYRKKVKTEKAIRQLEEEETWVQQQRLDAQSAIRKRNMWIEDRGMDLKSQEQHLTTYKSNYPRVARTSVGEVGFNELYEFLKLNGTDIINDSELTTAIRAGVPSKEIFDNYKKAQQRIKDRVVKEGEKDFEVVDAVETAYQSMRQVGSELEPASYEVTLKTPEGDKVYTSAKEAGEAYVKYKLRGVGHIGAAYGFDIYSKWEKSITGEAHNIIEIRHNGVPISKNQHGLGPASKQLSLLDSPEVLANGFIQIGKALRADVLDIETRIAKIKSDIELFKSQINDFEKTISELQFEKQNELDELKDELEVLKERIREEEAANERNLAAGLIDENDSEESDDDLNDEEGMEVPGEGARRANSGGRIKKGVSDLFESYPELATIGTKEQYSQYPQTEYELKAEEGSVEVSKTPKNIIEAKEIAENILKQVGLEYSFIGSSDTNGLSVYFDINGRKVRFSDHEISNKGRLENESTFYFGNNAEKLNQSILALRYDIGDKNVEYGKFITYKRTDGKEIPAYGYRENPNKETRKSDDATGSLKAEAGSGGVEKQIKAEQSPQPAAEAGSRDTKSSILDKLERLKIDTSGRQTYALPFPPQLWNGFISAIQIGVKAGERLAFAINRGVAYLKEQNVKNIDDYVKQAHETLGIPYVPGNPFQPDLDRPIFNTSVDAQEYLNQNYISGFEPRPINGQFTIAPIGEKSLAERINEMGEVSLEAVLHKLLPLGYTQTEIEVMYDVVLNGLVATLNKQHQIQNLGAIYGPIDRTQPDGPDYFKSRFIRPILFRGTKSGVRPFTVSQRIRDLFIKELGFDIQERMLRKRYLGVYKHQSNRVRVQSLFNVIVAAHEGMHAIDFNESIPISTRVASLTLKHPLVKELEKIYLEFYPTAKQTAPTRTKIVEGMAVLIERYCQDPIDILKRYPMLVDEFIDPNGMFYVPKTKILIDGINSIIQDYSSLPKDSMRIGARMSQVANEKNPLWYKNVSTSNFRRGLSKLKFFLFNTLEPARFIDQIAGTSYTNSSFESVLAARRRLYGIIDPWIHGKAPAIIYDGHGNYTEVGDLSIANMLKGLSEDEIMLLNAYLIARRGMDDLNNKNIAKVAAEKAYLDYKDEEAKLNQLLQQFGTSPQQWTQAQKNAIDNQMQITDAYMADYYNKKSEFHRLEKIVVKDRFDISAARGTLEEVELQPGDDAATRKNKMKILRAVSVYDNINQSLLDYAYNGGLINRDKYIEWKNNRAYASFQRHITDDMNNQSALGVQYGISKSVDAFRKREGSDLEIMMPVYSQISHINQVITNVHENLAWQALEKIALRDSEVGRLFEKHQARYVNQNGRMVAQESQDDTFVKVLHQGKASWYKISPELAAMRKTFNDNGFDFGYGIGSFFNAMGTLGRFTSRMITTAYPLFFLINLPVDTISKIMNAPAGGKGMYRLLKYLPTSASGATTVAYNALTEQLLNTLGNTMLGYQVNWSDVNDKLTSAMPVGMQNLLSPVLNKLEKTAEQYRMYSSLGARAATMASTHMSPSQRLSHIKTINASIWKKLITFGPGYTSRLGESIESIISLAEIPSNTSEYLIRFETYKQAKAQGDNDMLAMFKAEQATVAFVQHGANSAVAALMRSMIFANAGMQVFYRYGSSWAHHPKRMAVIHSLFAAASILMINALLDLPDDDKRLLDGQSLEEWGRYFTYKLPGDKNFTRVRIPDQLGFVNMLVWYTMRNNKEVGDKELEGAFKSAASALSDVDFINASANLLTPNPLNLIPVLKKGGGIDVKNSAAKMMNTIPTFTKTTIEAGLGVRTYPKVAPLDAWMTGEDVDKYDKYTSGLAKTMAAAIGGTPIQHDHFIKGTLGRSFQLTPWIGQNKEIKNPLVYSPEGREFKGAYFNEFYESFHTNQQSKESLMSDIKKDGLTVMHKAIIDNYVAHLKDDNVKQLTFEEFRNKFPNISEAELEKTWRRTNGYFDWLIQKDVADLISELRTFYKDFNTVPKNVPVAMWKMIEASIAEPRYNVKEIADIVKNKLATPEFKKELKDIVKSSISQLEK